jgi:hypothetical protein
MCAINSVVRIEYADIHAIRKDSCSARAHVKPTGSIRRQHEHISQFSSLLLISVQHGTHQQLPQHIHNLCLPSDRTNKLVIPSPRYFWDVQSTSFTNGMYTHSIPSIGNKPCSPRRARIRSPTYECKRNISTMGRTGYSHTSDSPAAG